MIPSLTSLPSKATRVGNELARTVFGRQRGKRPPLLAGGLPYAGHALEFSKAPLDLISNGWKQHGDVFNVQLMGRDVSVLIGAEANAIFFRAPDSQLSPREVYRFTVPVFGKGMVYDAEPDVMSEQMGFLMPALRNKPLRSYVELMTEEVENVVDSWADEGTLELVSMFTELTTYMASRALLGQEFRDRLDSDFAALFHDLERGMNQLAFFFPHLPLPVFRKRDAARAEAVRIISEIIDRRRKSNHHAMDMIQALMEARYQKSGRRLTEDEVTGMVLAIAFAGHHNSAVTAAWTTIELLKHPETMAPLLREQHRVHGNNTPISFDSLKQCSHLEATIQETGRLHPPLIMLMRAVLNELSVPPYSIPAGDLVLACPAVSHSDARSFEHPCRFDPERFLPPRDEHKKPYALVTFGAGKHRCIGMQFALLLQKTLWSVLLRKIEFLPTRQIYEPDFSGFVVGPKAPVLVRYRKIGPDEPSMRDFKP